MRGMPTPTPAGRLPALKAAHDSYGADDWASQKDLAELYGVAPSRLSTLVRTRFKGFPAPEKRGDKTHWYPARAAIVAMIEYIEGNANERQAQARRHTEVMTGVSPARDQAEQEAAAAEPPLSAAEIDRLVSAQSRLWKLQKDQGLYVLADDVRRRTRAANALFVRSIMSMPSRLDPNGALPPQMREALEKECRRIVVDLRDEMAEMLSADDEDAEPTRSDGGADEDHGRRRRTRRG